MFNLMNVKWGEPTFGTPSGTVTWSSELGGDLDIAGGSDLDDILASLRNAFDAWENVAAVDFQEVVAGGNITVGTASLTSPTVAQANLFADALPGIDTYTSVDIDFSSNETWAPSEGGGFNILNFYAIAVHEIGHAIGLGHPMPPDPSQIMNFEVGVSDLSNIDIAGAQTIYGTDGADVEVTLAESGGGGGGGGALGLLLGLLALLSSFFTGGAGAAVAMAAARVYDDGKEDEGSVDEVTSDDLLVLGAHDCVNLASTYGETAEAYLPMIDFTALPNPCGCIGLCGHIIEREEPFEPVEDLLV